jgi:hypothetical protein
MTTTVLGFKISMPIMIAPTAMQKMAHPEGMSVILLKLLCFFGLACSLNSFKSLTM